MRAPLVAAVVVALAGGAAAQRAGDREIVATLAGPVLRGGIVAGLGWDGGMLIIQSAAVEPTTGALKGGYFQAPGKGMAVVPLKEAPPALERYWKAKASRVSPTGLGRITSTRDSQLPMLGIGSLERRLSDAHDMGGMQQKVEMRLDALVLHERTNNEEPYDGEIWSWSPAELNRIAYVDGKGDLWIARADGRDSQRLMRGSFTLPAWSEDGRTLAVAERKDNGRKWEISVIHLPEQHRR